MKAFLLFLVVVAAGWGLSVLIKVNPGQSIIHWGQWRLDMQTGTLLLSVLLCCVLFYAGVRLLMVLLGLPERLTLARERRQHTAAAQHLTQGLIQLAEGHWDKAEQLLVDKVAYSDTPLLNYLTAARAAHMQGASERRDDLLRQAIASDTSAQVAVGVSRAEMQLADAQLEQAHATLENLRTLAPRNRYVLKLYAKTLYRQAQWEQLLALLPELQQHDLLDGDSENMQQLKAATLRGVFSLYAQQQAADKLQAAWQQLPAAVSGQPETQYLYASALQQAGADASCAAFIVQQSNASGQNEQLTELYGKLSHHKSTVPAAILQAQQWLQAQPDNPVNLLLLGRLYQQQSEHEQARAHYVASLNQAPDASAYLELAELLEVMEQPEQAARCYRIGLRYSIRGRGERLVSGATDRPPLQVAG